MSSTVSFVAYHERQTINNGMDIDDEPTIESPALSHKTKQENAICLNKATENLGNTRPLYKNNEASSSRPERAGHIDQGEWQHQGTANMINDNNIINIQLPYNLNVPTEPELWSGIFHPISLHGSIEQITLDTKSIKDSLNFMAKYISNKKVNSGKANDLQDFNSMGDLIWNFISVIYQANWDSLSIDNNSKSLREKISSKFTPRIVLTTSKNNKEQVSRLLTVDFILFFLFILFYFTFLFLFIFLFLEQLRLGFICHAVTSVTNWWRNHKTDHKTWENEVKGSGTKWHHTA